MKKAYCLLHSYFIFPDKLKTKCRADKPFNPGSSYKQTGKNSDFYRCRLLIFLEVGDKK